MIFEGKVWQQLVRFSSGLISYVWKSSIKRRECTAQNREEDHRAKVIHVANMYYKPSMIVNYDDSDVL